MITRPIDPTRFRIRPRITVARDARGWYAAMIHTGGKEIDCLAPRHTQRRWALDEARDWARETGLQLVGM